MHQAILISTEWQFGIIRRCSVLAILEFATSNVGGVCVCNDATIKSLLKFAKVCLRWLGTATAVVLRNVLPSSARHSLIDYHA